MKWRRGLFWLIVLLSGSYLLVIYLHFEYISHHSLQEKDELISSLLTRLKRLEMKEQASIAIEHPVEREEISLSKTIGRRELTNPWKDEMVSKIPRTKNEADLFRNHTNPVHVLLWAGGDGSFNG